MDINGMGLTDDVYYTMYGWRRGDHDDATMIEMVRRYGDQCRAEGAREALAGVRPLADEMFRSGDACNTHPDEVVSAEIAAYHAAYNALRGFFATLPPHDATGTLEVGHG